MSASDEFSQQLAEAARAMQGGTSTRETLDKIVHAAIEVVRACDLVGISLVHPGGIDTPAGNDEALNVIDALQFRLHEGPCYDALRSQETVVSSDLATDERWPRWGPLVAKEIGVASVASYRLFTTESSLGAMNLYSRRADAFDADDVYIGQALAAHAAMALAASQNVEHLELAIAHRTVIGQAEGILMERFDLGAAQAFAVLRRLSQARNVKLNHIAEELVRTRETPDQASQWSGG